MLDGEPVPGATPAEAQEPKQDGKGEGMVASYGKQGDTMPGATPAETQKPKQDGKGEGMVASYGTQTQENPLDPKKVEEGMVASYGKQGDLVPGVTSQTTPEVAAKNPTPPSVPAANK